MVKIYRCLVVVVLCLLASTVVAQVPQWRDLYKVKKKDTLYGIAKKFGLTEDQLRAANPEMKAADYTLKKGDRILIPYPSEEPATPAVKPAPVAKPVQKAAQKAAPAAMRVGVMLPLHNINGDGRRMMEYYRGLLMGCDSLKRAGYHIDVHAWNVTIDDDITKFTSDPEAAKCNIIFGPLYTHQVRGLAEFCKARDIKMVIPFSINGDDVARYSQIFQVWQSPDRLNNSAIEAYLRLFPQAHPVFIDCNDTTSRKGVFTFGLRNRLESKNITYNITNLNSSEGMFAKAFRTNQQNVVILNTGRMAELTVALAKLASLQNLNPNIKITLFGYTDWLLYADYDLDKFFHFDTYIPAQFYYNPQNARTRQFEQTYRRWFHEGLQVNYNPRFGLTGYDHAQFFLRGLVSKGKAFRGTKGQSTYTPLQTPLRFRQVGDAGMQNESFQLIHYTRDHRIEAVAY